MCTAQHKIVGSSLQVALKGCKDLLVNTPFEGHRSFDDAKHAIKIDLHALPKGTYFIHYQTKGDTQTKKLLKY